MEQERFIFIIGFILFMTASFYAGMLWHRLWTKERSTGVAKPRIPIPPPPIFLPTKVSAPTLDFLRGFDEQQQKIYQESRINLAGEIYYKCPIHEEVPTDRIISTETFRAICQYYANSDSRQNSRGHCPWCGEEVKPVREQKEE